MADITNPHDKFFREVWSRQEIAVDFLANYLPEDVSKHLLLDTLEIQKDSFIEKHLKEHFSDLLYRIELKENSEAFVYMLFEHKSYPDTHVAVQLLRYMGAIWQQHLKADAGNTQLPVIIPLVFYHGTEIWKPRKLSDLLASTPVNLTQYIPDFNFAFSDFAASSSPVEAQRPVRRHSRKLDSIYSRFQLCILRFRRFQLPSVSRTSITAGNSTTSPRHSRRRFI